MPLTYTLIAGAFIAAASLIGIIFTGKTGGRLEQRHHHYLLAFSLGVLLVTLVSLGSEGVEHFNNAPHLFGIGALCGIALLLATTRIHAHHHHAHGHSHTKIQGTHVLISDGIHNISDGLILFPAFLASFATGLAVSFGIFIHELVQEIAEFFILKEAGYTNREALTRNLMSATTIFIGIFIAAWVSSFPTLDPWLHAIAFGAFLYLIFVDIVPCLLSHTTSHRTRLLYVGIALCGALLMLSIRHFVPEDEHMSYGTMSTNAHTLVFQHLPSHTALLQ